MKSGSEDTQFPSFEIKLIFKHKRMAVVGNMSHADFPRTMTVGLRPTSCGHDFHAAACVQTQWLSRTKFFGCTHVLILYRCPSLPGEIVSARSRVCEDDCHLSHVPHLVNFIIPRTL